METAKYAENAKKGRWAPQSWPLLATFNAASIVFSTLKSIDTTIEIAVLPQPFPVFGVRSCCCTLRFVVVGIRGHSGRLSSSLWGSDLAPAPVPAGAAPRSVVVGSNYPLPCVQTPSGRRATSRHLHVDIGPFDLLARLVVQHPCVARRRALLAAMGMRPPSRPYLAIHD
jgi:hypothetical protein